MAEDGILWRQVRERVSDLRVAVVSNRNDQPLCAELQRLLGVRKLKWVIANPRKIDALARSMKAGNYGLVIALTGFIKHKVDGVLSQAARRGDVIYVRADKGRPHATLHALVRDLGIE